ncbi:hypothetical protein BDR03DRAFT_1008560 [Suillus americanus]|nr:hypothetical protein BDR03DRAFT_1008560 [Suillus americanus]
MAVLAASCTVNSQSMSPTSWSPSLVPTEDQPKPPMFEGDFVGTYREDDIEWPDDNSSDSSDEEEDLYNSGEWELPIQDEDEWEPPVDEGNQAAKEGKIALLSYYIHTHAIMHGIEFIP